ncbi:hypothetical protein [Chryseobacterium hagamense]|uniref:Uncharacterized protein n=1 Tax=Chryseobacterium hagamense TaxID=395935 RepID=A0A511YGS3_9FLAO|nr:hypothetical protein [Chryseobacterium hagamense]GEN74389.1 hypothetical protein CHA01nite_01290 [Chryseobacterium hagamense]
MNTLNDLISKSNLNGFKIKKIDYISEKQQIILIKEKQDSEVFIEILDVENNIRKEVLLDEKIYLTPYERIEFHAIDQESFYLSINSWHFKINSDGKTVLKKQLDNEPDYLNHKHILKNYIFREDLTLIDLEDFKEYDLTIFFDENFDEYDFTYFYFEDRYGLYSSSDNNILTITLYCKDRENPNVLHCVLKINSFDNIDILLADKIDQLGCYYIISENLHELAYETYFPEDENLYIREISKENFKRSKSFVIDKLAELIFF